MEDGVGGRKGSSAAEELILRTVAAYADSLLRTARRHSICLDDAQDAYQHALEIFMRNADRLDPARAAAWLHVVVKREAQQIRRSRGKHVSEVDVDLDGHEARSIPTPDERLMSFDTIRRSAEALQRLKPHELRALWLKAQGHTYSEIATITGWSYSKVNRCLCEGRRSFLESYQSIESGAECERWLPVISALVDGEATPQQILGLRPHLRNCGGCRGTLKALQDSSGPLAAVLPVPLLAIHAGSSEQLWNLLLRAYEAMSGGLHERAVHSVTKAQVLIEASVSGKVAAVAASAAAVAGGGYTTLETAVQREPESRSPRTKIERTAAREASPVADQAPPVAPPPVVAPPPPPQPAPPPPAEPIAEQRKPDPPSRPAEFDVERSRPSVTASANEFGTAPAPTPSPAARKPRRSAASQTAHEFSAEATGGEFGP